MQVTYKTRQDIFDNAYNGLKSQGWKRSINNVTQCVYRGAKGKKCAIGWNMPDDKYDPSFERGGVSFSKILTVCDIAPEDNYFSNHLQRAHDDLTDDGMQCAFIRFAKRFDLKVPESC